MKFTEPPIFVKDVTYGVADEKDALTGELLYEIVVRIHVRKKRIKDWQKMAKCCGCSLLYFIDRCLWHGERTARDVRRQCEEWLQSNRVATATEINDRARAYCNSKKGGMR